MKMQQWAYKRWTVVVYMGDDVKDACVYKFISKNKYDKSNGKENTKLIRRRYTLCC